MSAMLGKALEGLGLQPGQTYRAVVEGHKVEVKVLEDDDTPTPELVEQVMLQPWVEFPFPRSGRAVIARYGPRPFPDPPEIPQDEEGSE